jgi:hypothetical protein
MIAVRALFVFSIPVSMIYLFVLTVNFDAIAASAAAVGMTQAGHDTGIIITTVEATATPTIALVIAA